jgi:hypothetical protein
VVQSNGRGKRIVTQSPHLYVPRSGARIIGLSDYFRFADKPEITQENGVSHFFIANHGHPLEEEGFIFKEFANQISPD